MLCAQNKQVSEKLKYRALSSSRFFFIKLNLKKNKLQELSRQQ